MSEAVTARVRDLSILKVGGIELVIACDSVGGIGPKPGDSYYATPQMCGHFAARVPLLELLCARAKPVMLIDTLCVEWDPVGQQIIEAIRDIASQVGLPPEAVNGSTEDNVATTTTGLGITAIGMMDEAAKVRAGGSVPGDIVLCLGAPRSAPHDEICIGHPGLVALGTVMTVVRLGAVHDALPVGSKGCLWEAEQLAASAGLVLSWKSGTKIDPHKSAGPSSCVLVSCSPENLGQVRELVPDGLPVAVIGALTSA